MRGRRWHGLDDGHVQHARVRLDHREQAETGFTEDLYGHNNPPWVCNYYFGGDLYAGLWANLDCLQGGAQRRSGGKGPRLSITKLQTPQPPVIIEVAE